MLKKLVGKPPGKIKDGLEASQFTAKEVRMICIVYVLATIVTKRGCDISS